MFLFQNVLLCKSNIFLFYKVKCNMHAVLNNKTIYNLYSHANKNMIPKLSFKYGIIQNISF